MLSKEKKEQTKNNITGIVGYGTYIPRWRIKIEEIAVAHNKSASKIKTGLLLEEKSVNSYDEDSATMAVEATKNALLRAQIDAQKIGAIYVGSESHPYAVKPTASIVGTALNTSNNYYSADLEFACKAGTAALQICYSLAKSEMIDYGLAIGTDTAQAEPSDILEYSASSAATAFIVGNKSEEILATIDHTISITTNTPDFWRRNLEKYPQHTGRFTGEPSYFKHVIEATERILEKSNLNKKDINYLVLHEPNGKFPLLVSKKLGFTHDQILPSLIINKIGNSYSASTLTALSAVLDIAKPEEKILVTSYGSGSGADSFILTTTQNIITKQKLAQSTMDYINQKCYINYLNQIKNGFNF